MPQNLTEFKLKEVNKYGISIERLRLLSKRILGLYSIKRSKKIIFISKYALDKTLKCFNEIDRKILNKKSIINYLPITKSSADFAFSKNYSQVCNIKELNLLYISRVDYYKNQNYVIDELELYRKNNEKKIKFLSAGSIYKPYYNKFKNLFSKSWANFKDNVTHQQVLNLYKEYDIGIFASTCESCPTIVLEMMKYGLPFIICDLPLYDEIVPSIYPRFKIGEKASLCNALKKLLSNPNLIDEVIIKGKEKVKEFNPENSISKLLLAIQS